MTFVGELSLLQYPTGGSIATGKANSVGNVLKDGGEVKEVHNSSI